MDSWVTSAFGSVDGARGSGAKQKRGGARCPAQPRSASSKTSAHSRHRATGAASLEPGVKGPSDGGTWAEKYAPARQSEVAGNKKKLESLRSWLLDAAAAAAQQRSARRRAQTPVLLVTGPCGCGKTAAVRALCKENGIEIQEWSNQTASAVLNADGTYAWGDSQLKQFESFLVRASKYAPLSIFGESANATRRRVVLLEELPNAVYRDVASFHGLLARYRQRGGSPLVIVFSAGGIVSQKSLFPDELIKNLQIECLSFNPVPKADICRRLLAIADREGVSRTCPDIKSELERVSCSSDGDIRSAINALQFNYGASDSAVTRSALDDASGKDLYVNLFRALGKVLYCKRTASEAVGEGVSRGSASDLPACPVDQARNPLAFNPEEVFSRSRVSEDFYVMCLHQNYLDFAHDISAAARSADSLSESDYARGKDWETSCFMQQQAYGVSIAVRGYLHANSSSKQRATAPAHGWKPLRKPSWYAVSKKVAEQAESVRALFADDGVCACSTRALVTELLPYWVKIGAATSSASAAFPSHCQTALARDLATFRRRPSAWVPAHHHDAVEMLDDRDDGADVAGRQDAASYPEQLVPLQPDSAGCYMPGNNVAATVAAGEPQLHDDTLWDGEEDLSDWELSDVSNGDLLPPSPVATTTARAGVEDEDDFVIEEFAE